MNKLYLLGPIAALAVFGAVYSQYSRAYAGRLAEAQRTEALARAEKTAADEAAKAKALDLAHSLQIKRNAERTEKERNEAIQKQARLTLEELRGDLVRQTAELRPQVALLQRELADLAKSIEHSEQRSRSLQQDEQKSLEAIRQAEARESVLTEFLEKLDRIDLARPKSPKSAPPKSSRG